jgi:hypothetical protein
MPKAPFLCEGNKGDRGTAFPISAVRGNIYIFHFIILLFSHSNYFLTYCSLVPLKRKNVMKLRVWLGEQLKGNS